MLSNSPSPVLSLKVNGWSLVNLSDNVHSDPTPNTQVFGRPCTAPAYSNAPTTNTIPFIKQLSWHEACHNKMAARLSYGSDLSVQPVCHAVLLQPPGPSTMDAKGSKGQKRREGALSLLNAAIEAMNLAKEISSATPAKAIFGSVSILLTMIAVRSISLLLR